MVVDKQLKLKSHKLMQVEFIPNNVDEMTHGCLSNVTLALVAGGTGRQSGAFRGSVHGPSICEAY